MNQYVSNAPTWILTGGVFWKTCGTSLIQKLGVVRNTAKTFHEFEQRHPQKKLEIAQKQGHICLLKRSLVLISIDFPSLQKAQMPNSPHLAVVIIAPGYAGKYQHFSAVMCYLFKHMYMIKRFRNAKLFREGDYTGTWNY